MTAPCSTVAHSKGMLQMLLFCFYLCYLAHYHRVAANSAAIYADQLGDFDWRLENIGLIEKSFSTADSLIVATTAGILASLDVETGRLKWRVLLPEHSRVEKFIMVGGDQIATLMSHTLPSANETKQSMVVRSWLLSKGGLLWDVAIGSSSIEEEGTNTTTTTPIIDALYDASRKRLVILFANCLHFITPPPIQVFPQKHNMVIGETIYWRWSAATDLERDEDKLKQQQQQLVLSSLIVPSKRTASQIDGPMRVAVGCLVDVTAAGTSSIKCNGIGAMLLLEMPNSSAAVAEFHIATFALQHAGLSMHPSVLRALVSSDASSSSADYLPTDVVFGVVADADDGHAVHLLIQSLHGSKPMEVLRLPLRGDATIGSTGSFVYRTTIGEEEQLAPAAYGCNPAGHCSSFLAARSGVVADDDQHWLLLSLLDGMVECVGLASDDATTSTTTTTTTTRVFSATQFQTSPHSSSLVRGVHSMRFSIQSQHHHPSHHSSKAIISEITITSVGGKGPSQTRLAPLSLLLPPQDLGFTARALSPGDASLSPVLHSMVLPLLNNTLECKYRLMLVLRSGATVMLSSSCTTDLNSRPTVSWYRMEALSSLQQAVLVGRPQQLAVREGAVPDWRQRLHLQGLELQVLVLLLCFMYTHGLRELCIS